jgi:hypothetical protein
MSQLGSITAGGGGGSDVLTLTGDVGGAVSPDGSGNINVITAQVSGPYASGTSYFSGSPNTLTWVASDSSNNCSVGTNALIGAATSGANQNTAFGNGTGSNVTGTNNAFFGINAGNTCTGSNNLFLGAFTGGSTSGNWNICIGSSAGNAFTGSETSNIYLNNTGSPGESNVLRIGRATGSGSNQDLQNAYICGINGVSVGSVASVVAISGDLLGSATITAGTGITVTPTANTITISSSSAGVPWTAVTGTSQAMAINNGYITNNAGLVTVTLPSTAAVGTIEWVAGEGAGGWLIAQHAGQNIIFESATTTTGTGGSLASTVQYDSVQLLCIVANTTWSVISSVGNITVT